MSASFEQRSQAIVEGVEAIDPEFVLHLPSSTLKLVLGHFLDGPGARADRRIFPIPREEEGISILSGLALAGRRAVMIFQDNVIGNMLTALLTFPQPYHLQGPSPCRLGQRSDRLATRQLTYRWGTPPPR